LRGKTYQSVACHARRREEASTASEFIFVKLVMPSCKPFRAMLAWWNARFRVSFDWEIHARCDAENARMECITNEWDAAMLRNLGSVSESLGNLQELGTYFGIMSVQRVDLEVLFMNISFEIVDKWWISRRSVLDKASHCGWGYTRRSGNGNSPVCLQWSIVASISGVQSRFGCWGDWGDSGIIAVGLSM
jgi:hypothetical protein